MALEHPIHDVQSGRDANLGLLYSIYPTNFPAGTGAFGRSNFGHGPAYDHPCVVYGAVVGPGTLQPLTTCIQTRLVVVLATGQGLGVGGTPEISEGHPVLVAGDDTVAQHHEAKVYDKAKHRDAVRSSHKLTVWKWGHKLVILSILIRLACTTRYWALPARPAENIIKKYFKLHQLGLEPRTR